MTQLRLQRTPMDNLVLLHPGQILNLLRLLRHLILRKQLLQVVDHVLELCDLSLTHLELLVPLHELNLEVVDVVLCKGQLVLGVLELGAGTVEGVDLKIVAMVCPNQLIVQLLVAHLEDVVLLE
jgi:hypothetical protein